MFNHLCEGYVIMFPLNLAMFLFSIHCLISLIIIFGKYYLIFNRTSMIIFFIKR